MPAYHNGIAEYYGADSMAKAAGDVLDNPRIALAVVHNALEADQLLDSDRMVKIGEYPVGRLPQHDEIDEVTLAWKNEHFPNMTVIPMVESAVRHGGCEPHIDRGTPDMGEHGPLTISVRVDSNREARRVYNAIRPSRAVITAEGEYDAQHHERLRRLAVKMHTMRFITRLYTAATATINQQPGDALIIMNFPYPTIHSVDTGFNSTQAVLYDQRSMP